MKWSYGYDERASNAQTALQRVRCARKPQHVYQHVIQNKLFANASSKQFQYSDKSTSRQVINLDPHISFCSFFFSDSLVFFGGVVYLGCLIHPLATPFARTSQPARLRAPETRGRWAARPRSPRREAGTRPRSDRAPQNFAAYSRRLAQRSWKEPVNLLGT